jgi:hypothetical protein
MKRKVCHSSKAKKEPVEKTFVVEQQVEDPPVLTPTIGLLKRFIHPLEPSAFLETYYEKRAFITHSKTGTAARFSRVMQDLYQIDGDGCSVSFEQIRDNVGVAEALDGLLHNTPSERISVWMRDSSNGQIDSIQLDDAEAAKVCYNAGSSLYFSAPEKFCSTYVRALSHDLGMNFAAATSDGHDRGQVEVFFSRAGHVTDWHFDFMENFTMQLKVRRLKWGEKRGNEGACR